MKYRIYHNPRCRKSREGLELLNESSDDIEVFEYIKEGVDVEDLRETLGMLGISADELCRKNEQDYKDQVKGKELSKDQIIALMCRFPKIIERPIVINHETKKAVIGRPAEKILEIL